MELLKFVSENLTHKVNFPAFKAGDTITVHYKIKEGDKERVQQYQGVVLKVRGEGSLKSFTVRKISNSIGVERVFPLNSPFIEKIEVNKKGIVRKAKIYYLRELSGKKARIEEKREKEAEVSA